MEPPQASASPSSTTGGTNSITIQSKDSKTVLRVKPSRVHGDGWDSEDPDREDDPLIEDGLILRMLPDANLDILRSAVESGDMSAISIFWKDKRRAIVKIHGEMYGAKLIDLPTVLDIHKTLDRKNIFKTIDVSQMLLVVKKLNTEKELMDIHVDKEFGETFPDGITPPMNGSKYTFTKKYENRIIQNVEDEVEKLLKLDAEAESSTYEFINPDEIDIRVESIIESKLKTKLSKKEKKKRRKEKKQTPASKIANAMDIPGENENEVDDAMDILDEELDKLIGDVDLDLGDEMGTKQPAQVEETDDGRTTQNGEEDDYDDDDDESDDDDEANVAPENAEIPINSEGPASSDDEEDEEEDDYLFNEDPGNNGPREEVDETKRHNAILEDEIKELEAIIEQKNKDLTKIVNPIMKNRINDVIVKLVQELEMKKNQIIEVIDNKEGKENQSEDEEEDEENQGDDEDDDDEEADQQMEEAQEDNDNNNPQKAENGNENEPALNYDASTAAANPATRGENSDDDAMDDDEFGDLF